MYTNSSLICYTKISPHKNSPRKDTIKKITIHHAAGNLSVEAIGNVFQSRQASSNYGIGTDGRIAMYVEEKDRAWTSSSAENDNQAVTIEVANDGGANTNWHVSDKALASLVDLCVDICKRNGIEKLNFTGNKNGNLTMHCYFAATACPGPYLKSKFPWIAEEVNKRLGVETNQTQNQEPEQEKEMYRVRKSWDDAKSQIGAYTVLQNAKNACDKAGAGYEVYNSKGEVVYAANVPQEEEKLDTSKVNTAAADPKYMWDYFKSKGLNDYGIAGLMGNLYAESALRPCNLQGSYEKSLGMTDAEYTVAVDTGKYDNFVNDKAGYGLAQWTYWSLKRDMFNYIKNKNKSIGDLDAQMEFLAHQLSTSYKAVWTTLQNATSVLEASNAMLLKFERPADQSEAVQKKRAEYGQKYFDSYGTKVEVKPEPESKPIQVPADGKNGQMKYSESNKPLVCMQTQSTCYKGTSKMQIKGVLWHSTGANNPTLKRYVQPSDNAADRDEWIKLLGKNQYNNDWNHISHQAGLNCWIGKLADGTVTTVQTMPWDYKPWGCGSGAKGSCNNGWIQFEICEDGLTDKDYFNKVYKEACEITAYLCKMYNIDPHGTVKVNGVNVPTILCHYDSHKLGFGSNHGDIDHWFPKHGKSMATARDDVAKLLGITKPQTPPVEQKNMYRVRKSWNDSKSQIGAYTNLDNAKKACDKAGKGYYVFDKSGKAIYPIVVDTKIDTIKEVQKWLNDSYSSKLTVDGIYGPKTKAALIKVLQRALGITIDGIYGSETNNAVKTLKIGRSGEAVKALQGLLVCNGYAKAYVDGEYGSGTCEAVKSYQTKKKLKSDGEAGRATFSALCK